MLLYMYLWLMLLSGPLSALCSLLHCFYAPILQKGSLIFEMFNELLATPISHPYSTGLNPYLSIFHIFCVGRVRISSLVTWNVLYFFIHLSLLMRLSHSDKVWHQCNIIGLCGPPCRSCDPFSRAKWSGGCQQHSEWCNDPNHQRSQRSTNQYHPMCEPTCELVLLETVYRFNKPFFSNSSVPLYVICDRLIFN